MEIRSHSFVIHQSEWATIEKGLIQRANLLDLIYKDIYGEQLLIKIILFQRSLIIRVLRPCFDILQISPTFTFSM
jgi:uncharacterized circularly permuted ATP-grasp superfamily protein